MENRSYTGREISTIRQSLVDKINTLTDKWTDYSESDIGMVFVEFIASVGDFMSFYLDKQALETYLDTAIQDKNVRSLLRVMNYRIPLLGGAKGTVRIDFEYPSTKSIKVPRYSTFFGKGISYCSVRDYLIHEGDTFAEIDVLQGVHKVMVVTRKSVEQSLTGRRIYIPSTKVAEGSVSIEQDGFTWEEVDDAILMYRGGRYYSLHRDSEGRVYILLSNNYLDLLPENVDEEVNIHYMETLGLDGVVGAGEITSYSSEVEMPSDKGIYNLSRTYGAWGEVDLNRAKILARNQAKTMDRYILLDDYKTGAETEEYVMKCKVADWKTPELVQLPYLVKVWAVDWSGNSLGKMDATSLKDKLESKGVSSIKVEVQDVERVPIDLSISLSVKTSNYSIRDSVREIVDDSVRLYFEMQNMDFGKKISISQIINLVMNSSSYIDSCNIISPLSDVITSEVQFPYLRSLSISFS